MKISFSVQRQEKVQDIFLGGQTFLKTMKRWHSPNREALPLWEHMVELTGVILKERSSNWHLPIVYNVNTFLYSFFSMRIAAQGETAQKHLHVSEELLHFH